MNTELLVCDPIFFRVDYEINRYLDHTVQPDPRAAAAEHRAIVHAHADAGRRVRWVVAAPQCPDMVYTANTAVVRAGRAVLGQPPPQRKGEIPYVEEWLTGHGVEVLEAPYAFGGQGDALPCGDLMLAGYGRRTDRRMHAVLARYLDCDVVALRTVSDQWYSLDLAVAVIDDHTAAYHPAALDPGSRRRLRGLGLELIEVSAAEAGGHARWSTAVPPRCRVVRRRWPTCSPRRAGTSTSAFRTRRWPGPSSTPSLEVAPAAPRPPYRRSPCGQR